MYYLGIDCGGTHLRIGIVDDQGKILGFKKEKTPLKNNPEEFAPITLSFTQNLLNELGLTLQHIEAIGIGVPGPIDFKTGAILKSSNLNNENPIHFKEKFESLFSKKIYFDRDTYNSLRGEIWKGGAKGLNDVVMVTLGTGVGGAVLSNGEIIKGESGLAAEIGHIFLQIPDLTLHSQKEDAPRCGLGHRGCFEALIKSSINIKDIGYYLGYGLANIVDIFNPEKIIIGGGMVQHGDFLPQAIKIMKEKAIFPAGDEVVVEYAKLEDLSGVVGSAKLALDGS